MQHIIILVTHIVHTLSLYHISNTYITIKTQTDYTSITNRNIHINLFIFLIIYTFLHTVTCINLLINAKQKQYLHTLSNITWHFKKQHYDIIYHLITLQM